MLLFIILSAMLLLWIWLFRRSAGSLTAKKAADYQNDLMKKYCTEVEHMYRQTRGWRHDYHNHIQTMKAYLSMGRLKELEQYLSELDQDLAAVDTVVKTGNIMVDAVLNSKLSLAAERQIFVDAKAVVPQQLAVSDVDLSLVIGNLLDNAIEGCMKQEKEDSRFIRVYIDILKGQLYIYVMNSTAGKLKRQGNIYLSAKQGKYHGFGLTRMDQVVKRYHGYLERQDEDGVFVTEIMLPI